MLINVDGEGDGDDNNDDYDGDDGEDDDDDDVEEEGDDVDVEEEDDNVEKDVEEEDRSQDWEAHIVRACAVEMHTGISQDPFCIIWYRNLQEKWPRTPPGTSFCASLGSRKAHRHLTRAIFYGHL